MFGVLLFQRGPFAIFVVIPPIDKKPLLCQCLIMTTVSESINTLTPLQAALRVSDQQFADGLGIPLTAQWMQNVQDRAKRNVAQGHLTGSALALPPSCIP